MGPARLVIALAAACISLSVSSSAAVVQDWKTAVGWNLTVLDPTSIGQVVGTFTPPAGLAPQSNNLAAAAVAPTPQGRPGGLFICTDANWKGLCGYAVEPLNTCILLNDPWLRSISSFGPDRGARCFAFASGDCDTAKAQWSFVFPGDSTGGISTTLPWNDQITSFACSPL
ncbi:hypothetical protein C8J57DRAFT_1356837 [Mycena rebaudengoi]|nr:hypothetical protein C8J57DRAFT_1356837 [Mycena rebaudengoi]